MAEINSELLNILACPACKTKVVLKEDWMICTNPVCGLRFPIRDGIPVMLVDQAQKPGR